MQYLEYLIWGYFIFYPIYTFLTHEKDKRKSFANSQNKLVLYKNTIIFLWVPTLIMLCYSLVNPNFVVQINWLGRLDVELMVGYLILLVILVCLLWSAKQIGRDTKHDKEILKSIADIQWMLPSRKEEYRYFALFVAPSAGICEEIMFRGILLGRLSESVSDTTALFISSIAFALPHAYQGKSGVAKTFICGCIFSLAYLYTKSLLIAMLLHTAIDLYSGHLSYKVLSRTEPNTN